MSPDLERLCLAASFADGERDWPSAAYEDIVRAVLLSLREPSEEAAKAARLRVYRYRHNDEPDVLDTNPMAWAAMIDHILADPVKA